MWVAEQLGLKKAEHRKKKEPWWKRRIDGDIKRLKQEVNFLERESNGELGLKKRKRKLRELNEGHGVKSKELKFVIEESKKRMLAKSAKTRRYKQKTKQFRQNNFFYFDREKIYAEFNGGGGKIK